MHTSGAAPFDPRDSSERPYTFTGVPATSMVVQLGGWTLCFLVGWAYIGSDEPGMPTS